MEKFVIGSGATKEEALRAGTWIAAKALEQKRVCVPCHPWESTTADGKAYWTVAFWGREDAEFAQRLYVEGMEQIDLFTGKVLRPALWEMEEPQPDWEPKRCHWCGDVAPCKCQYGKAQGW